MDDFTDDALLFGDDSPVGLDSLDALQIQTFFKTPRAMIVTDTLKRQKTGFTY